MKKLKQNGFTIIELLIASLVFTTVLLLCLEGITRLGKAYTRSTSISKTNALVRDLVEDVAQQIRFGASTPSVDPSNTVAVWGGENRYCFGGYAYSVRFNTPGASSVRKKADSSCSNYVNAAYYTTGADDLALPGMRVLNFSVSEGTINGSTVWSVNMRVALAGTDDLLMGADGQNLSTSNFAGAVCRGSIGSEFCAVSEMNTSVTRRITGAQ